MDATRAPIFVVPTVGLIAPGILDDHEAFDFAAGMIVDLRTWRSSLLSSFATPASRPLMVRWKSRKSLASTEMTATGQAVRMANAPVGRIEICPTAFSPTPPMSGVYDDTLHAITNDGFDVPRAAAVAFTST